MTSDRLGSALRDAIRRHGDTLAVADLTRRLTYAELDAAADEAGAVVREVVRGSRPRVAIRAKNSPSYVVALLALLRSGAVPFLVDPALSEGEFAALVTSCGLTAVIHAADPSAGAARELEGAPGLAISGLDAPASAELLADTELCRFSSGSTRSPACIEFRGAAVLNAAAAWTQATGLRERDVILCFAGLYNGLAFNTSLIPGLLAGCALWLPHGLPSAGNVTRHVAAIRPSVLVGFPALYDGLVRRDPAPDALRGVRIALSSAAKLSEQTAQAMAERYGVRIADYYGIAETGPLTFDPVPAPGGGQGRPLPGVQIRLAGQLAVRSGSMGSRYLNYPGEFEARLTEDGFYRTGDEGAMTDGRLVLAGRGGKELNIGGRKVAKQEVADAILRHPAVRDCVVFGSVNLHRNPVIAAVVVADQPLTAEALRHHCARLLAAYKIPERIAFTERIPRGGSGKPLAAALDALL
jgi:acyl-CoA synthetase (AMP-forming)/AMP-acid ligase II